MRCLNCGWDCSPDLKFCQKCGQPLQPAAQPEPKPEQRAAAQEAQPKKTVLNDLGDHHNRMTIQKKDIKPQQDDKQVVCINCGYPISSELNECPSCGALQSAPTRVETPKAEASAPKENQAANHRQTVRGDFVRNLGAVKTEPKPTPKCRLVQLSEEFENITPATFEYEGENVALNRENTEPGNITITSRVQADLTFEDGHWALEDKSDLLLTIFQILL